MRQVGDYDIDDPKKIQGRDEVDLNDHSLAALRLREGLDALGDTYGRVLLLGCGAGRYVRALNRSRPDLRIHGGDLSLPALHEARQRDERSDYVALDASRLPYRDGSFSAVLFFDLLEHVPDFRGLLRESRRVLEPCGVLHFFVPLEAEPGTLYHMLRHSARVPIHRWKRDHVGHINRFVSDDVIRSVWDAGFEVSHVRYGFHLTGQVHDVVDYWQRERASGGPGTLSPRVVELLSRGVFLFTWRLSYLEDRLYGGRTMASGLHLTAHTPK
jgi:SAM-dependent methyltransferase